MKYLLQKLEKLKNLTVQHLAVIDNQIDKEQT